MEPVVNLSLLFVASAHKCLLLVCATQLACSRGQRGENESPFKGKCCTLVHVCTLSLSREKPSNDACVSFWGVSPGCVSPLLPVDTSTARTYRANVVRSPATLLACFCGFYGALQLVIRQWPLLVFRKQHYISLGVNQFAKQNWHSVLVQTQKTLWIFEIIRKKKLLLTFRRCKVKATVGL